MHKILALLSLLLALTSGGVAGCHSHRGASSSASTKATTMNSAMIEIPALKPWLDRRALTQAQVREILKPRADQEDAARSYQKLKPAAWMHNPTVDAAHYYFQAEKLVMIYLSDKSVMGLLVPADLEAALGPCPQDHQLRSRAGKTANQYAYPEVGIVYAVEADKVKFVELFPPCSLKEYLANIYETVGPWLR